MKNVNAVVLALCLVLGAGSVFAQENQMGQDARNHDETAQAHDGMKKNAMTHDAMKMDTMHKGKMAKGAMPKDAKDSMMKDDKASPAAMGDEGSQH
jgi:pentapeptide MXKDX repeat protein